MFRSRRSLISLLILFIVFTYLWYDLIFQSWALASLYFAWPVGSSAFRLSLAKDGLDVNFTNYSINQVSAAPFKDVVPPVLHHIALGKPDWQSNWGVAVQTCLDLHPGWESHIWTDETATKLVAERFPHLQKTWEGYKYPIQRVDALRYMVLYEYGGVVLDMDLMCRRALGPLRRFNFVAPEAHPTGFSIGFMMAERSNAFVGRILNSLPSFDRQWLWLPYATVMFSTGCHFASVIHAMDPQRHLLKILPGPLHSLSGHVSTPLFEHLGSSSWHSYDARMLKLVDSFGILFIIYIVIVCLVGKEIMRRRRARLHSKVTEKK